MTTLVRERPPVAWSVAGSDSGGGAGIQADLLTFHDFGIHGCTVITALTAQNSFAVGHISVTPHRNLAAQINALDSDLPAAAIKLGMLADVATASTVMKYLEDYEGPVICDPVFQSTSGSSLLAGDAGDLVAAQLLPRALVITPNRYEAEAMLGRPIRDEAAEVEAAGHELVARGARSVLITGGHFAPQDGRCGDFWTDGQRSLWLYGDHVDTIHNHGTGCTLSSAIAAAIALGHSLEDALVLAKAYVTRGLRRARQVGSGPGPVAHSGFPDTLEDLPTLSARAEAPGPAFADCGGSLGLYPVVDSADWVERLVGEGVTTIQLRIKGRSEAEVRTEVERSVTLCRQRGVRLFVNDYWQLAIEAGAYGVHLGQEDLDDADLAAIRRAGLRLGVSTHSWAEIARAHWVRPSYIALGPIHATTSKEMPFAPQGLARLQQWTELLAPGYVLTAIGGINGERAPAVLATGVGSCALISAITEAEDWRQATRELLAAHGQAAGDRVPTGPVSV